MMEHLKMYCSDLESTSSKSSTDADSAEENDAWKTGTLVPNSTKEPDFFGFQNSPSQTVGKSDEYHAVGEPEVCASGNQEEQESWMRRLCSDGMEDATCADVPQSDFWKGTRVQDIQPGERFPRSQPEASGENIHRKHRKRSHPHAPNYHSCKSAGQPVMDDQSLMKEATGVSASCQRPLQTDLVEKRKIFFVHSKVTHLLSNDGAVRKACVPSRVQVEVGSHPRVVNRVRWGVPQFSHLLLSASMDGEVRVWSVWSQLDKCVRRMTHHSKAVRDVHWDGSGTRCLSCSYDRTAALCDVETGQCISTFQHQSAVSCGQFHPAQRTVFLTGSSDIIHAWDSRQPAEPLRAYTYKDRLDQIQDVMFCRNGDQFFTCCGLVSRDSADRTLMAWDFSTGTILSNQIFQERYSCTRLRLHPSHEEFLAQTQGGYIAIFSTQRPYKMNKVKRFQGHQLLDYSVAFDVSGDGSLVVSGSSDGSLYCFHYHSGRLWRKVELVEDVCTDLAFHPLLPSTLAAGTWGGRISVLS